MKSFNLQFYNVFFFVKAYSKDYLTHFSLDKVYNSENDSHTTLTMAVIIKLRKHFLYFDFHSHSGCSSIIFNRIEFCQNRYTTSDVLPSGFIRDQRKRFHFVIVTLLLSSPFQGLQQSISDLYFLCPNEKGWLYICANME